MVKVYQHFFTVACCLSPHACLLRVMEEIQDSGPGPEALPTQNLTPDHLNNKAQDLTLDPL